LVWNTNKLLSTSLYLYWFSTSSLSYLVIWALIFILRCWFRLLCIISWLEPTNKLRSLSLKSYIGLLDLINPINTKSLLAVVENDWILKYPYYLIVEIEWIQFFPLSHLTFYAQNFLCSLSWYLYLLIGYQLINNNFLLSSPLGIMFITGDALTTISDLYGFGFLAVTLSLLCSYLILWVVLIRINIYYLCLYSYY